jgi:YesN/AraC family two-component response regulator
MKNILIVEDNSLERRLIVYILKNAFENHVFIFESADGIEALKVLSINKIDLVITDLVMPNVEGMELIRKIKSNYTQTKNILAISGKNPYYLLLAKKMGVQGIFTKPLDRDKFLMTVSKILNIESKQLIVI